jgi:hypothetical protein
MLIEGVEIIQSKYFAEAPSEESVQPPEYRSIVDSGNRFGWRILKFRV